MAANVSRRLARLSDRLAVFDQVVVRTAGESVHDALLDEAARDTGGDRRLSGLGKIELDVQLSPLNNPVGVRIRPSKRSSGVWTIVSKGTAAHAVQAKAKRKRKAKGGARGSSRSRAMRVGDGGWAVGPWTVGGTSGKGTWPRGVQRGLEGARDEYRAAFRKAVQGG